MKWVIGGILAVVLIVAAVILESSRTPLANAA